MNAKKVALLGLWAGLALLSAGTGSAVGADFTVETTSSFTFSPALLSVAQGDTVTWTNTTATAHTSTSGSPPGGDGLWGSPVLSGNGTFSVTFTNFAPKAYPYFCSFHYFLGMTGSLTVTNATTTTAPSLANPLWTNGTFQLTVDGKSGSSYVVERTVDLTNWTAISTNVAPSDRFNLDDTSATNHIGFYRLRLGL